MGCKQLDACGSLVNWSNHLQLKNPISTELWLSNRRGKLARAAAKAARVHSDEDNALPEKETGSGPDPDSPDDLLDEDYDPSPSTSHLTHRKDRRRSVSRTKDTVVVPEKRFKFKVNQNETASYPETINGIVQTMEVEVVPTKPAMMKPTICCKQCVHLEIVTTQMKITIHIARVYHSRDSF
ncbi:uncharacterized protein LOC110868390 isoform X2 [Helianthus annuus]|uniref:uncharacterized protein LOC110868390 isoform X2 n=1 Tax=Helianthus annuus TaxID=4232 RepID=UPI000B8FE786|nr:uncharacterized protein LOC110868390 isoform X2 [Helianthus annuus]